MITDKDGILAFFEKFYKADSTFSYEDTNFDELCNLSEVDPDVVNELKASLKRIGKKEEELKILEFEKSLKKKQKKYSEDLKMKQQQENMHQEMMNQERMEANFAEHNQAENEFDIDLEK